jgi:nitroimidazol reductase NimA-like FMN-containing flavoprotein (pyridoxamine 5'-phosphate oxidase superfamily)
VHHGTDDDRRIGDKEGPSVPGTTLVHLSEEDCLQLLDTQSVGRIAVVHSGDPLILPVNFILEGRTIAFRTDPGSILDWATLGRVAFEIDGVDSVHREGWSVLVQGVGREITDADDAWSQRITARTVTPWAGGAKDHWVAIATPVFSGRRIVHQPD